MSRNWRKHVETLDWEPTDTKVHVSDVANLIERLGGAELYGAQDKLEIALRELIQNSSDAIVARRASLKNPSKSALLCI